MVKLSGFKSRCMKSWGVRLGGGEETSFQQRFETSLQSLLLANCHKRSGFSKKLLGMEVFQSGDHLICKLHQCLHRELALAAAKEILQ